MDTNQTTGADTFFIGADIGDAAIYISWSTTPEGTKKIEKAVMMDGGSSFSQNYDSIYTAIADIEDNFECQGKGAPYGGSNPKASKRKRLLFDSFVITHWDHDHYHGVMVFLAKDTMLNAAKLGKLSRAIYVDNEPKSTLYAPYWYKCGKPNLRCGSPNPNKAPMDVFYTIDDEKTRMRITTTLQIRGPKEWHGDMLRMRVGTDQLLGRDFFQEGDHFDPTDVRNRKGCKSLNTFMLKFREAKTLPITVPALYCVAVNMEVMGKSRFGKGKEAWPASAELTFTNMSSVCSLLAWQTQNYDNNFLSVYAAADAPSILEMDIAEWMQKSTVTLHKLSHHGSASSTPVKLLPALKPRAIVSMSGNNPNFSHPRWEVVFDIYGLHLYGHNGPFLDQTPLYLLRWPAYLVDFAYQLRNHKSESKFNPNMSAAEECYDELLSKYKTAVKRGNWSLEEAEIAYPDVLRAMENELQMDPDLWKNKTKLKSIILPSLFKVMFPTLLANYNALLIFKYSHYVHFRAAGTKESSAIQHKIKGPLGNYEATRAEYEPIRNLYGQASSCCARKTSLSSISSWECIDPVESFADGTNQIVGLDSSNYHYLIPQKQQWSEFNKTLASTKISSSNSLHDFLDSLPTGRIELVMQPDVERTKGRTPGSVRVAFAPSDEWYKWLQDVLAVNHLLTPEAGRFEDVPPELGIMYMEASKWPPTDSTNFDFTIEGVVMLSDGTEVTVELDTKKAAKALLDSSGKAINAMFSQLAILPFGVSVSAKAGVINLGNVAELIRFPYSKTIQLLRELPLKPVNPDESGRTAMWYSSGQRRATDLRLEFLLDESIPNDLNTWLQSERFGITVKNFRVVARRNIYYRAGLHKLSPAALFEAGDPASDGELPDDVKAFVLGSITFDVSVVVAKMDFSLFIAFDRNSVTFRLQRDGKGEGGDDLATLLQWAYNSLGGRDEGEGTLADEDYKSSTWGACDNWLKAANELLWNVRPRVLEFALDYDEKGKLQGVQGASITLQVELKVGKAGPIVIFVTFGWSRARGASMDGRLWNKPVFEDNIDYRSMMPAWESRVNLEPNGPNQIVDRIDLKDLLGLDSFPEGVPREITEATLSVDGSSMSITTFVSAVYDKDKHSNMPKLSLDVLEVSLTRTWGADGVPGSWDARLGFALLLFPLGQEPVVEPGKKPVLPYKDDAPCYIRGNIQYQSNAARSLAQDNKQVSLWTLEASVSNLKIAHLATFWDKGPVREAVMTMLSHLVVEQLTLTYLFGPNDGDGGKDFTFIGVLKLGSLGLDLKYHYDERGWDLSAGLIFDRSAKVEDGDDDPPTEKEDPVTVKKLLVELIGKDSLPDIPGDVLDIPVGRPGSEGELLSLKCFLIKDTGKKDDKPEHGGTMMTTFSIQISAISLTLIQWRHTSWESSVPSKRVVKVALNEIGPVTAPLVGQLKQPFEQLVYMWVSDRTSAAKPKSLAKKGEKTAGITKSEFGIVSDRLVDADKLYFKSDAPDPDKIPDGEFVIEAGSHFMIVAKNSVGDTVAVLDYVFGRPNPQAGKQILVAEEKNKDPAKAPFKKSVGPLLIENIGLTYNATEKRLGVILDATFLLGPIGLALLGFGVNVKLAKDDNEEKNPEPYSHDRLTSLAVKAAGLGSLPISDPQVTLEGLMVSFDRPPVTIAGGFARTVVDEVPYYAGGLIVGFVPWKLMAMGVYGEVPKEKTKSLVKRGHRRGRSSVFDIIEMSSDDELDDIQFGKQEDKKKNSHDTFTMVFVILKVEGPLFSIGFADISGLTAGVGVNSAIRLPTAETVLDFPFTKPSGTPNPSEGPLAALKTVLRPPSKDVAPWFTAREGSFWIAAGLKVTALSVLSADAVLVITTTPSVQIGIFGVAVIDVPSLASPVKFAHAELGIACVFDPEAGTFRFDAQLSPRSYVLHESCHLSGGMALYAWAKTGDFVMTLGGYHQAFAVPAAYPRPPRLGIAWSLGDNLRISGEAYFAVTARVCMGGGKLNATLSIGPLSAWFDAFLDFLINFRPFKFAADGGIAVGVRFSLDLWLVTVRINAEIKATLSVLGPPMAGTVHVDFWVFGFDIDFGDRAKALEQGAFKLSLDQFKNLVLKGGGTAATGVPMPMDWVDVKNPIMTTDDNPASQKTSERFLFNCTAGLLPENNTNIASGSKPSESCNVSWMRTMFGDNKNISKNTWAVKAGELEFNITLAFAASAVTVKDNRNTAIDKVWTVTIPAAQQEIYALPMRLTGAIESTVEMTIDQEEEVTKPFHVIEEEKRSSKRWLVKPILKNVPMNLWGRYDAASDPALAGNAVKSLLNPATATGSVSLVMGLSFQPPLPAMSKDKVPKFNIVADMLERVNNDGYPFKEIESVASDAWKPLPRREYEGEWKRVKHEWEKDGVNERANKVVGLWSAMMNWSKEKDKVLMGTRPGGLLGRYEDMLPVPPRIASAA